MLVILLLCLIPASLAVPIPSAEEARLKQLQWLLKHMSHTELDPAFAESRLDGEMMAKFKSAVWGMHDFAGILAIQPIAGGKVQEIAEDVPKLLKAINEGNKKSMPILTLNDDDQILIEKEIITPLNVTFNALGNYADSPDKINLQKFKEACKFNPPLAVSQTIKKHAPGLLTRCYNRSHIIKKDFDNVEDIIQSCFIYAHLVEAFHNRLISDENSNNIAKLLERFQNDGKEIEGVLDVKRRDYDVDIMEEAVSITKKQLDKYKGSSLNPNTLADRICDKLNKIFEQKYLAVIVYKDGIHAVANPDKAQFAKIEHNGYTVLITMGSRFFARKSEKFRETPRSRIEQMFRESFKANDLTGTLQQVRNGLEKSSDVYLAVKPQGLFPLHKYYNNWLVDGFVFRQDGTSPCPDITQSCEDAVYKTGDILVMITH